MTVQITAETLAKKHKSISIAEFFEKNKHLLGYENLQKSLLTCIREAVDNSLDACEDARILPNVYIEIQKIEGKADGFKIIVEDNGPGIVKANIPKVFGKLLYGSKFHRLKQSRGQQGIGISAAVLYSQLTTGKAAKVYSKIGDGKIQIYELRIDTTKNEPEIISENTLEGYEGRGTRIEISIKGKYSRGKQSVPEYLQETAIMNPFARMIFVDPENEKFDFERAVETLPPESKEIKPHPAGLQLGVLIRMLETTQSKNLTSFLSDEFSRMGRTAITEILLKSELGGKTKPKKISRDDADRLLNAMQNVKIQNPPTNCLSAVGEDAIKEGLKKELRPEFISSVTRPPSVYHGNPFLIEVGLAYGGNLEKEGAAKLFRYANKVPLLYEQSACAITKSVLQNDWKRYHLKQSNGSLPIGPLAISIHIASVWVPYTSEGKEAIASYSVIIKEVKLALQEAGRKLSSYLGKKKKAGLQEQKKSTFARYIGEVAEALSNLTSIPKEDIDVKLQALLDERIGSIGGDIEDMQDDDYKKDKETGMINEKSEPVAEETQKEIPKQKTLIDNYIPDDDGENNE
ncbi:MAG: DNA topoisomerase VI subunit B [Candidatus Aenigmarchaeota archaeon]|nr:DNA topoisomerase VI subunit B [Candidatus Aenigmarchaeota archaeon]